MRGRPRGRGTSAPGSRGRRRVEGRLRCQRRARALRAVLPGRGGPSRGWRASRSASGDRHLSAVCWPSASISPKRTVMRWTSCYPPGLSAASPPGGLPRSCYDCEASRAGFESVCHRPALFGSAGRQGGASELVETTAPVGVRPGQRAGPASGRACGKAAGGRADHHAARGRRRCSSAAMRATAAIGCAAACSPSSVASANGEQRILAILGAGASWWARSR